MRDIKVRLQRKKSKKSYARKSPYKSYKNKIRLEKLRDEVEESIERYNEFNITFPNSLIESFEKIETYILNSEYKQEYKSAIQLFRYPKKFKNLSYTDINEYFLKAKPTGNVFSPSFELNMEPNFMVDDGTTLINIGIHTAVSRHYNLMVFRKMGNRVFCLYIEPHGIFKQNKYNTIMESLKNKKQLLREYESVKMDDEKLNSFLVRNPLYQDRFFYLYQIETFREIQNQVRKFLVSEVSKNKDLFVLEITNPGFQLQHNDTIGFCQSSKLIVYIIDEIYNKCKQIECPIDFSPNHYIEILTTILISLNKTDFIVNKPTFICDDGNLLCSINMMSFLLYNYQIPNKMKNTIEYSYYLKMKNDTELMKIVNDCYDRLYQVVISFIQYQ